LSRQQPQDAALNLRKAYYFVESVAEDITWMIAVVFVVFVVI
jgi:hypothetical protein